MGTKCQECIAEIRGLVSIMGGEAGRIIVLSGSRPIKKKAKDIYSMALKVEKLLAEKNGK